VRAGAADGVVWEMSAAVPGDRERLRVCLRSLAPLSAEESSPSVVLAPSSASVERVRVAVVGCAALVLLVVQ